MHGGDYIDASDNIIEDKYALNYNNIFVAHIAATKELDGIVQSQAQEINDLKNENLIMKTALNKLLLAAGEQTI